MHGKTIFRRAKWEDGIFFLQIINCVYRYFDGLRSSSSFQLEAFPRRFESNFCNGCFNLSLSLIHHVSLSMKLNKENNHTHNCCQITGTIKSIPGINTLWIFPRFYYLILLNCKTLHACTTWEMIAFVSVTMSTVMDNGWNKFSNMLARAKTEDWSNRRESINVIAAQGANPRKPLQRRQNRKIF